MPDEYPGPAVVKKFTFELRKRCSSARTLLLLIPAPNRQCVGFQPSATMNLARNSSKMSLNSSVVHANLGSQVPFQQPPAQVAPCQWPFALGFNFSSLNLDKRLGLSCPLKFWKRFTAASSEAELRLRVCMQAGNPFHVDGFSMRLAKNLFVNAF